MSFEKLLFYLKNLNSVHKNSSSYFLSIFNSLFQLLALSLKNLSNLCWNSFLQLPNFDSFLFHNKTTAKTFFYFLTLIFWFLSFYLRHWAKHILILYVEIFLYPNQMGCIHFYDNQTKCTKVFCWFRKFSTTFEVLKEMQAPAYLRPDKKKSWLFTS